MSSSESSTKHRRPHRKSRLGCHQCKRRKIKCDETRPACLNCVRREVNCSYPSPLAGVDGPPAACTCKCSGCRSGADNSPQSCHQSISVTHPSQPGQTDYTSAELPRRLAEQSVKLESVCRQLTSMENTMVHFTQLVSLGPILSYADIDLTHHFYTSTLSTLGGDGPGREFWSTCLPNLGFQHPHLYHLMLALAALHKARLHSHQQAELLVQAERHHVIGVQGATALLGSINDDNYEVVHTSAILIGLINLAMGPRPGEYIAFSEQVGPNFLGLLRGVQSIRHHKDYSIMREQSPADSSLLHIFPEPSAESQFANEPKAHLRHLYSRARKIPEARLRKSYILALDDLEQFFVLMDGPLERPSGLPLPDTTHRQSPLGWLYRIQDDFLEQLRNKESLALVVFAYFAVVLKELELGWPADGWAEHIMADICEEVGPDERELIRWPMSRLNGMAREGNWPYGTYDAGS